MVKKVDYSLVRLKKMETKIKSCLIDIQGRNFVAKTWCKANGVQTSFMHNLADSGLIKAVDLKGKRIIWECIIPIKDITLNDVANVIKSITKSGRARNKTPFILETPKDEKTIADFGIEKLQTELERRGFVFNLTIQATSISVIVNELKERGYTFNISKLEEYENK